MDAPVQHVESIYSDLIDRCGRLRMLSHRIALFAALAESSPPDRLDDEVARLRSSLNTFDELYESVRSRRTSEGSPQVAAPSMRKMLEADAGDVIESFRHRALRLYDRVRKREHIEHEYLLQFVDFVAGSLLQTLSALTAAFVRDLETEAKVRHAEMHKTLREIRSMSRGVHFISLNASIASARAGASGALFGSIAKEISALATESGASAERLGKLLEPDSWDVGSGPDRTR